ncbi:hypothetical protein QA089_005209 [Meyerozyma guilliermondii]
MSRLQVALGLGALLRVALPVCIPSITESLSNTVEISTPITSFKAIKEAFYYLDHGIDLYDGGIVHHPPLLVVLLSLVNDYVPSALTQLAFSVIYTAIDLWITNRLILLNRWYNAREKENYEKKSKDKSKLKDETTLDRSFDGVADYMIASVFLFNPLLLLTTLSFSTINFTFLFVIEAVSQITLNRNYARAVIALALATYLSWSPVFLIVPLLALGHSENVAPLAELYAQGSGIFITSCGLLLLTSFALTASFGFVEQCYGTIIFFSKIVPNVGLWWYIFTEMFNFFTPFYLGVFNLYSAIFIVPISVRFFRRGGSGDPFLAYWLSYLWLSFTKSYPGIADLGLMLSILPIFYNTALPHCKFLVVTALTLIVCLVLSPIFYHCWIVLGNGNSNFFYSMNLVWGAVHVLVFMDLTWGRLTYDYLLKNGEGDEPRLTQI